MEARPRINDSPSEAMPWDQDTLGPSLLPPTLLARGGEGLTIDCEGHLSLPGSHAGHHGSAHVLPSILLADGFEGQGLFIA